MAAIVHCGLIYNQNRSSSDTIHLALSPSQIPITENQHGLKKKKCSINFLLPLEISFPLKINQFKPTEVEFEEIT